MPARAWVTVPILTGPAPRLKWAVLTRLKGRPRPPDALEVSRRPPVVPPAGADAAPLGERMAALLAFRAATVVVLAALGLLTGVPSAATPDLAAVGYLAASAALTVACRTGRRPLRRAAFAAGLLADGLFLDHRHGLLDESGHSPGIVVAAFLVAVCLLGSLRAGLALAVLLSVLPWVTREAPAGASPPELLALWTVVAATTAAAAIPQREARRRRRDAEALQRLATALHEDATPGAVAARVLGFAAAHLGAARAAVVSEHGRSLRLVAG
ncbi:MAG: hypothetical protein ACFCVG_13125, partial [Kineosporiaceae bacterium]